MMQNLLMEPALEDGQILLLAKLAKDIWPECYENILSENQIKYMLKNLQSASAIARQIKTGNYQYFLMLLNGAAVGYLALKEEGGKMLISKLYVLKSCRGQGLGKSGLLFAQNLAQQKNCKSLWLTVNRENAKAIKVYKKAGFSILRTENADIGGGFFMEDFVLEKTLP